MERKTQLILIRGLPGSGKSTLAKAMSEATGWPVYEADQYFIQPDGGYIFDRTLLGKAHANCIFNALSHLAINESVIVANTFTTRRELQPYHDAAQQLGATVTEIVCTGPWRSIHDVPEDTIRKMRERWEE